MSESILKITYQCLFPGWTEVLIFFLIGDPFIPYSLTEYTHFIHNEVILKNFLRSSVLRPILTKHQLKLEKIPYIVFACLIVHNFCELSNIQIDEELA